MRFFARFPKVFWWVLTLWVGNLLTAAAWANETTIRQRVNQLLGGEAVKEVRTTPMPGLYEVALVTGEVVYTNEAVSHILVGSLIDAKTRENLTEKRLEELNRVDFAALPFDQAFAIKKGKGERVFVTFEDPNCSFCKRLAREVAMMDNVTQYVFLLPILGPDSLEKAKRIWCDSDRAKAWQEWMIEGKAPAPVPGSCDTRAIERNLQLGQKLAIGGTPAIILPDGSRIGGFVPKARLEERLQKAMANAKASAKP